MSFESWSYDVVSGWIGFAVAFLVFMIPLAFRLFYRKKANYDCSKCKAWDCDGLACYHKRMKNKGG